MWIVFQEILPVLLIVFFVSQYIAPVLLGTQTWWLFKREKKVINTAEDPSTLAAKIKSTKVVADKVKARVETIKTQVEENLKSAEDLKKDAENLI